VLVDAARESRVDAVDVGTFTPVRKGFLTLPVRQRAPTSVGGYQVHQMRCARAGKTDDDERTFDLDLVDLRVPA